MFLFIFVHNKYTNQAINGSVNLDKKQYSHSLRAWVITILGITWTDEKKGQVGKISINTNLPQVYNLLQSNFLISLEGCIYMEAYLRLA